MRFRMGVHLGDACKLRIVLDAEVGLAAGESGKEIPMLLDVLAVVERLATPDFRAPAGRRAPVTGCWVGCQAESRKD